MKKKTNRYYNKVLRDAKSKGFVIRTVIKDAESNSGYSFIYDTNNDEVVSQRYRSSVPCLEILEKMVR